MSFKFANFLEPTLQQSVLAADTTFYVEADQEALFPVVSVSNVCRCVIYDGVLDPEIIDVTAHTGGALTVVRARESTSAQDWPAGARIRVDITAEMIEAILGATVAAKFTGTATGTDSYTVTADPSDAVPTPNDGDEIYFSIPNTNTGACTITFTNGTDSIGPTAIVDWEGDALESGDFMSGKQAILRYQDSISKWVVRSETSGHVKVTTINDGPLTSANRVPNGDFRFWNAGTSFVTPASGTTVCDGFYVEYDGTIGAFTVSRQSFTLGQTDVPGNPKFFARWDQGTAGSGSTYRRFRTKVPGAGWRQGEKVIHSVYMKADAARTVNFDIIQYFGTGGSPSADVTVGTVACSLTTSWQRFDLPVTMSSLTGKTFGSSGDDAVMLSARLPLNTTMTIDFAMMQMEPGEDVTTPWSNFPLSFQQGGLNGRYESRTALLTAWSLVVGTNLQAWDADLDAFAALDATAGLVVKTGATAYTRRSIAVGTGLTVSNGSGAAGNPTVSLDTALTNYVADPLSVAELASITGAFGTAAFVADTTLCHLAGAETITGTKTFNQAVGNDLTKDANGTTSHYVGRRFQSSGTQWTMTPAPSGTPDTAKDFGYDFTNSRWFFDANLSVGGVLLMADGAVGAPAIAVGSATTTGLYYVAGEFATTVAGVAKFYMNTTRINCVVPVYLPNGSASACALCAATDVNTGFIWDGSDGMSWVLGGTARLVASTTAFTFQSGVDAVLDSALGPSSIYSVGFRGAPLMGGAAVNAARTFAAADMGKTAYHDEVTARTWTIDSNANYAAPIGSIIIIDNTGNSGAAGTITLQITSDTLRRGDGVSGTGSRSIAAGQVAVCRKTKTTEWVITGSFS